MIDTKLWVGVAALGMAISLNAEAKLYKWVDANGTTHYGETIPPEYADRNAVELNNGRIAKRPTKVEAEKLPEKDPVAEKARMEAKRRDNALLNTYSTEEEIDLARDRNLQQVVARTTSYAMLLKSAQENMDSLQQELETRKKQGREVPQSLKDDLAEAKVRIAKTQGDLDASNKEQADVKARYAADKVRYRELKGLPAKSEEKPKLP